MLQFLYLPQLRTPVCPLPRAKTSVYSTSSRLKLTKAGRGREDSSNSEQFYDSVYYTAAKTLLPAAWEEEEQCQNHPFNGGAKTDHESLTCCVNRKIFRSESFPQRTVLNMECLLHSVCSVIFCHSVKYRIFLCFNNKLVTQRQERLLEHDQLNILKLSCFVQTPKIPVLKQCFFQSFTIMCHIFNKLSLSKYLIYRNQLFAIIIRCGFLML